MDISYPHLHVHIYTLVQNFPEAEVLHCQSKEVVEAHFKSRLKEVRV